MASLSSSTRLGNTSTSALIRSATSIQNQVTAYNDEAQRLQFENDPSNDNLQTYLTYLQGRINSLQAAGDIASQTKALAMGQTMTSAVAKNTSFTIQNQAIQVMAGTATPQDKLDVIGQMFQRAQSIGDETLAQSLMSQGYALSQQIQYQQQVAAEASVTLQKANDSAIKAGYTDAIAQIKDMTANAIALFHSGAAEPGAAFKEVTSQLDSTLKTLTGEGLPKGTQANLGSVLQGMFNAEFAYAQQAADVLRPTDPQAADKFAKYDANGNIIGGTAADIMNNQAFIKVPGIGNVNAHDAAQFANNPNLIGIKTDENGQTTFYRNPIIGYSFKNGVLTPETDQATSQALVGSTGKGPNNSAVRLQSATNSQKQLENLGFTVDKVNKDGTIEVQFTSKTDHWTQAKGSNPILSSTESGSGNKVTLIPQVNGTFQFARGNNLFSVALDAKGLGGIFQTGPDGAPRSIAGQYGFNQQVNTMISNATTQQLQQQAAARASQLANAQLVKAGLPAGGGYFAPVPGALQGGTGPSAYTSPSPTSKPYQMTQRAGGGFNFTNNGKAISAAEYAQANGIAFRDLLTHMAQSGDSGAKAALGFVGNDFRYDPSKISAGGNANIYNALTWGTGLPGAHVNGPNTQGGQLTLPSGLKL